MLRKIAVSVATTLCAATMLFMSGCGEDTNGAADPCEGATALQIVSPVADQAITVGQTVTIKWCLPATVQSVNVILNVDDNEVRLNRSGTVDAPTNEFPWVVEAAHVGTDVYVIVNDYNGPGTTMVKVSVGL